MRCWWLILTLIYSLSHYEGTAQDIQVDLVAAPKEDPWKLIRGVVQDPQGFLWLGTATGLYRYDGYKCVAYHHEPANPNSLARNWIECLYGGQDNFLLIGTFGAGLDRFDLSTRQFTHFRYNSNDPQSLSNDTVTALIKDRQGLFWIATHNGLNRFNPQTGKFTRYKNDPSDTTSLSDNQVRALFEDRQGTIWVGTESPWVHDGGTRVGGLNRFIAETAKFVRYRHNPNDAESIVDNRVTAIFEDRQGTFWVGTAGNGLDVMNREKGIFEHHLFDPAHPQKLSLPLVSNAPPQADGYITFIKEDPKGNVWIATLGNGIHVYNPSTRQTTHYGTSPNSQEKVADDVFTAAAISKEGIFWVAAWDLNLYQANPYKTALPYIPVGKAVTNFCEDSHGNLWMTTAQGLVRRNKDGTVQQFLIDQDVSSTKNFMRTIQEEGEHTLWIGTAYDGLYCFNPVTQTFTAYRHKSGKEATLICDTINILAKGVNNKLWIGTFNGLDRMDLSSGVVTHYAPDMKDFTTLGGNDFSDQGNASVTGIALGSHHRVWLCIGGDVNRLDEQTGHFKKYPFDNEYAYCILEDRGGNVWVGSGAGLFRYQKSADQFVAFYDSSGVINRHVTVSSIIEDHQKNLWLKTLSGFIKLNLQTNEVRVYENKTHPSSWPILKAYLTDRGEILSGDTAGYFAFSPDGLLKGALPPDIVITDLFLSDELVRPGTAMLAQAVSQTKELRLNHHHNTFSFKFTSIDFTGSGEDSHILYKLGNYDPKWRKADGERTGSYYNVPPGTYLFKIKAMNSIGVWGEKELRVVITPPWWRTWWAYGFYLLCLLAGVFALDRYQRRRLIAQERERTRERELAQARQLEQANQLLEQQKEELQTTLEDLKATQTQLIQKEKMASLGELTAGIAHEIQNPLNFVNNFAEVNQELLFELGEEIAKGDLAEAKALVADMVANEQKILEHGKRADGIVKGMLQHSRAGSGEKQLTDLNALTEEYLRLSYHGLRAKDQEFNATLATDLDAALGRVEVVPQELGRVLLNLFNNAFYATQQKKQQLNGQYQPEVQVHTKRAANHVEIRVKDNGTGIPESVKKKIFQPFFTTKPTGQGTGLGLSLSYDIITKGHGGELKVESQEGDGAEFIIILPTK